MLTLLNILGIVRKFISFIIDIASRYPLQILLVLVCWYAYHQTMQHKAITQEFGLYKADIKHKAELQILQDNLMRKQADSRLKEAETIYDTNLEAVKNEYLKKQKLDSVTIGDLRNRLREQVRADSFTMPETPADTETNTEVWRNSHTAITRQYETLIDACRITTNDFNLLRDWADVACNQLGCE